MKPTNEQRLQWLKEKRCHVCGKNTPHTHPHWMWLANPVPESEDKELQDRIEYEKKANEIVISGIVGRKA